MKVGILTFHHAANYGAVWQAICLWQEVQRLGHEPEIIDFRPRRAMNCYRRNLWCSRHALWNLIKQARIWSHLRNNVALSTGQCRNGKELAAISSRYDAIIVGSDEVWNIEGIRGWEPAYFLDFAGDDQRKISYAASTGHGISLQAQGKEIARFLGRFAHISVRDGTSARIVSQLTGRRPALVVDPTLLHGERKALSVRSHIALYGGLDPAAKKWLRRTASEKGIRVISLGFSNRTGGRNRIAAGLNEWLDTIGSASLVITTTFHGLLAAIVHRRPFWVLPRRDGATKVWDFLNEHGLKHRMLDSLHLPDSLNGDDGIDFDLLWENLGAARTASSVFLAEALRD